MNPLTIWSNADLEPDALEALKAGTASHRLVMSGTQTGNLSAGGPSPELVGASIAFGQPDPAQLVELDSVKWVHITSAGYTRYDRSDLRHAVADRHGAFTNSSSVFDEPCAQHLLAFMLSQARQLPASIVNQSGPRGWPYAQLRPATRLLQNETVLIFGYGAIARRLVALLEPFHLTIIGVRRTPNGTEGIPVHSMEEANKLIPIADHIVNILPASPSTDLFFDAARFGLAKQGAVFYNVGRGTTVDQIALCDALEKGKLGAAYLDVTEPEPLPSDHPLWAAPNCVITPHTAGGHAGESLRVVEHFLSNLRRFEAGQPLADRVF